MWFFACFWFEGAQPQPGEKTVAFTYNENNIITSGDHWFNPTYGGLRSGPITVTQDGLITTDQYDNALSLDGGPYTLVVNGVVQMLNNPDTAAISLQTSSTKISNITVGATGIVEGTGYGIHAGHATNIKNDGVISGGALPAVLVLGGATTYSVSNAGIINGSTLLDGTSKITVTNSGTMNGALDADAGAAVTLTNTGTVSGYVVFGSGADALTNKGTMSDEIQMGAGDDKFTNNGKISSFVLTTVDLGTGKNNFTNTGVITGKVSAGENDDTFTNSGKIEGSVDLGNGTNKATNSGDITGGMNFGSGADTLTNNKTIGGVVVMDAGANTVTNTGTINHLVFGNDADKFTNNGTVTIGVDMGEGGSTVFNTGSLVSISFGSGIDKFTNSGTVLDVIDLGAGNDVFTGGNADETVRDGEGADKYALGGGNDVFLALPASGARHMTMALAVDPVPLETLDGGANRTVTGLASAGDVYDLTGAAFAVYVNLDSVDHNGIAKGTATGGYAFNHQLKNFESVTSGDDSDYIWGNSSANVLLGGGSFDYLRGLGGNDFIDGGTGWDQIWGGAGADKLWGGSAEGDNFYYESLSDSTVATAGRDTIMDFEDGSDAISLADSLTFNTYGAITVVANAFSGGLDNAEVRAIQTFAGWTLQFDTNGDKKVDMAIDVVDAAHLISWSSADFIAIG